MDLTLTGRGIEAIEAYVNVSTNGNGTARGCIVVIVTPLESADLCAIAKADSAFFAVGRACTSW
jgi:hypothetical protein